MSGENAFAWLKVIALLLVTAILGYGGYRVYKFVMGLNNGKPLDLVNPQSPDNVAYQAANAVTREVIGNNDDTLGTAIYGRTHTDDGRLAWWRALPGGDFLDSWFTSVTAPPDQTEAAADAESSQNQTATNAMLNFGGTTDDLRAQIVN